jgi:parallel beta-helix repeat protein
LDCYNVTIENNTIYNNTKMGIMLSRNMTDSIVRYNTGATKTEELLFLNPLTMRFIIILFQIVVVL